MITRSRYYKYKEKEIDQYNKIYMDNCYDCSLEQYIHERYIKSKFNIFPCKIKTIHLSQILTKFVNSDKLYNIWVKI